MNKKSIWGQNSSNIRYLTPIIMIGFFMVMILAALLQNTVKLHGQLKQNTENYADDISVQLANNISARMKMRGVYIRNLADTFSRMPTMLLTEELLERKAEYLQMEEIFVINADGSTIPKDTECTEVLTYLEEHRALYTQGHIFFTATEDHEEIFFSSPILWEDGNTSVLIGVRTNALLQQMLREVDFENQGLSCIVDSSGTVIVSAEEEAPFEELDAVFEETADGKDAEIVEQVLNDIENRQSGVAQFHDINGEPVMLGYDFLGINDWMLLTLLPSNLFSQGTEGYLVRYAIIIGTLMLGSFLILAYITWSARHSLQKIQAVALTDPLTGGMNQAAFQIEGRTLLQEYPQQEYTIVYLNIRNFKLFNERFGVKAGDEVLWKMYLILEEQLQPGELLTRASDDHFYLLLECGKEKTLRRLEHMLEQLEGQLASRFYIGRSDIAQGAYLIENRNVDFMVLSDWAKTASAYQPEGGPCRFYDEVLSGQMGREQALEEHFEKALESHEFQIYIQPKVRPGQKKSCEGEILVRWQHPEFGLLFPGEFIPLFERSGNICELDFYMLEEACKLLQGWLKEGKAVPLSVNLSRAHLRDHDMAFLERMGALKKEYQIPDGLIELELTETMLLGRQEFTYVTRAIEGLRAKGFLCSIDDFGFGYSSLALLKDLNVDTIKLDRQFFMEESEKAWNVVSWVIQLAHSLQMTVVAEGIENWSQVERLGQYECDLIQGYVYAKPMPAADFEGWSV